LCIFAATSAAVIIAAVAAPPRGRVPAALKKATACAFQWRGLLCAAAMRRVARGRVIGAMRCDCGQSDAFNPLAHILLDVC